MTPAYAHRSETADAAAQPLARADDSEPDGGVDREAGLVLGEDPRLHGPDALAAGVVEKRL